MFVFLGRSRVCYTFLPSATTLLLVLSCRTRQVCSDIWSIVALEQDESRVQLCGQDRRNPRNTRKRLVETNTTQAMILTRKKINAEYLNSPSTRNVGFTCVGWRVSKKRVLGFAICTISLAEGCPVALSSSVIVGARVSPVCKKKGGGRSIKETLGAHHLKLVWRGCTEEAISGISGAKIRALSD